MSESGLCRMNRLIIQLVQEGWKIQRDGVVYINGTLGTNLYKDGEIISISQEFMPDEETIKDLWPEEVTKGM
jgi:hypothetical protein